MMLRYARGIKLLRSGVRRSQDFANGCHRSLVRCFVAECRAWSARRAARSHPRGGPGNVRFVTPECETRPYLKTFLMAGGIVMRRTILASALISFLVVYASSAWAWWDAGHMR
jgi:hypothetical protein